MIWAFENRGLKTSFGIEIYETDFSPSTDTAARLSVWFSSHMCLKKNDVIQHWSYCVTSMIKNTSIMVKNTSIMFKYTSIRGNEKCNHCINQILKGLILLLNRAQCRSLKNRFEVERKFPIDGNNWHIKTSKKILKYFVELSSPSIFGRFMCRSQLATQLQVHTA